MAKVTLTQDEERRVQQILERFTPDESPVLKRLREKLSDEEWQQAERFVKGRQLLPVASSTRKDRRDH